MPAFYIDLRSPSWTERNDIAIEFDSLEAAYLDVCEAIPAMTAELLSEKRDPTGCVFEIRGAGGEVLMEVPFTERVPWRSSTAVISTIDREDDLSRSSTWTQDGDLERAVGSGTDKAVEASRTTAWIETAPEEDRDGGLARTVEEERHTLRVQMHVTRCFDVRAHSRSIEALARSYELLSIPLYKLCGDD